MENDNIKVSYKGSVLDDGTILVTSENDLNKEDFEKIRQFENDILTSAMTQYNSDPKQRQYSVIAKDNDSAVNITLEKVNNLAIGIHSDLEKLLEANRIILQAVTLDAYMGRAYECIYSNVNTSYKLNYPKAEEGDDAQVYEEVKQAIENFNSFIHIEDLIKDSIAGTFLEGNYSMYLRFEKNRDGITSAVIDHYPLDLCYPSDYYIDRDNILQFDINVLRSKLQKNYIKSRKTSKAVYFAKLLEEVEANFSEEVVEAFKNNEMYARLDDRCSGLMKINDMGRKFGVSPFFKALRAYIVLNNIEAADVADSKTRSKKIIFQKLRKELMGPTGQIRGLIERELAHTEAVAAINTNFCLYTAPAFVEDLSYVIDKSTNDNTADSIKIYTSKLLTALGISFVDSSLSSYSTANISVDQLMRTINSISEQLEKILHKFYILYLEEIGLPRELAPRITIIDSEMMDWALRKEFASFIYSTLGASRDTTFRLAGLNLEDEAIKRRQENQGDYNEVFKPRPTDYNTSGDSVINNNNSEDETVITGRPASSDNIVKQEFDREYSREVRD